MLKGGRAECGSNKGGRGMDEWGWLSLSFTPSAGSLYVGGEIIELDSLSSTIKI